MSSDGEASERDEMVPGGITETSNGTYTSRQPSRSDIEQAVASRLQTRIEASSTEGDKRQTEQRAKLRRLIHELTSTVNYDKASACLRLIHTLLDNISRHPTEAKYRSFKASQPKIARDVLSIDQGKALLVEIGFRTRSQEFQQEWFVPMDWKVDSFGFKKMEWSRELIGNKMHESEENAERVRYNKEREKNVELNRKSRALEEAREDRERVALRAEREKIVRKAAEARAAQAEKEASEAKDALESEET